MGLVSWGHVPVPRGTQCSCVWGHAAAWRKGTAQPDVGQLLHCCSALFLVGEEQNLEGKDFSQPPQQPALCHSAEQGALPARREHSRAGRKPCHQLQASNTHRSAALSTAS